MTEPVRQDEARLTTHPTDGTRGIVVSPHFLASRAGIDILAGGGNAADAAIAVNAVLGVVLPDTCGLGGDLFALVHSPGNPEPAVLNASGMAGSGVSADDMRDEGLGAIPYRGYHAVTVPGCVDGWYALADSVCSLPLNALLEPAIEIARSGFPVSSELASSLDRLTNLISEQPSAHPFYKGGAALAEGDTMKRGRLAETLESIADGGRDEFYGGDVGRAITEATRGALTKDDLAAVQAIWVEPIGARLFGSTGWTVPPNSQGYITLVTLRLFELLEPPDDPNDPLYQHLLIEAYRCAAWDREDLATDLQSAGEDLVSDERLEQLLSTIDPESVGRWPVPRPIPSGTAYMTVRDRSGMGISLIQSNFWGIGSGLSAGDTGVFLHNRGAGFNLIQGHTNEFAPGKRPLHTLSPTLWTTDGTIDLLLGTRGGDQQPQFLAQYAASFFHARNCTDDSQLLPRWSMSQPRPGSSSVLKFESRVAPTTIKGLVQRGHTVEISDSHETGWGPVSAIDGSREFKGSADPRVSTSAALIE